MLSPVKTPHNSQLISYNQQTRTRKNVVFGSNNSVYAPFEEFIQKAKKPAEVAINAIQNSLNDGRFSLKVALKNYLKGIVSPVTAMFKSVKSFVFGAVAIAAASGLCALGLAPLLVAIGLMTGVLQAGKAVYKFTSAKNGDDVEKAFYDAGSATSSLGLSLMGARASLRNAGVNTDKMTLLKAVIENFKQIPSSLSKGANAFKAGMLRFSAKDGLIPVEAHIARIESAGKIELLNPKGGQTIVDNPYKILGVKESATLAQIKLAYRKLAIILHPDHAKCSQEYFKDVGAAYRYLSDAGQRPDLNQSIMAEQVLLAPLTLASGFMKNLFRKDH